jgi:hypothetical protein
MTFNKILLLITNDYFNNYSISNEKMIEGNDLYHFPKGANIEKIDLNTFKETYFKRSNLELKHNKLMALAWYYTMKGNDLKTTKKTVKN